MHHRMHALCIARREEGEDKIGQVDSSKGDIGPPRGVRGDRVLRRVQRRRAEGLLRCFLRIFRWGLRILREQVRWRLQQRLRWRLRRRLRHLVHLRGEGARCAHVRRAQEVQGPATCRRNSVRGPLEQHRVPSPRDLPRCCQGQGHCHRLPRPRVLPQHQVGRGRRVRPVRHSTQRDPEQAQQGRRFRRVSVGRRCVHLVNGRQGFGLPRRHCLRQAQERDWHPESAHVRRGL
mmetsp:Transcript_9077/g.21123  ORF Transcript_9077/g.21123 Transcript_9077/m.21123 type:complete len:233 (+) Transcript_9077:145-843(+)